MSNWLNSGFRAGVGGSLGAGIACLLALLISPGYFYLSMIVGGFLGSGLGQLIQPANHYLRLLQLALHRHWIDDELIGSIMEEMVIEHFVKSSQSREAVHSSMRERRERLTKAISEREARLIRASERASRKIITEDHLTEVAQIAKAHGATKATVIRKGPDFKNSVANTRIFVEGINSRGWHDFEKEVINSTGIRMTFGPSKKENKGPANWTDQTTRVLFAT